VLTSPVPPSGSPVRTWENTSTRSASYLEIYAAPSGVVVDVYLTQEDFTAASYGEFRLSSPDEDDRRPSSYSVRIHQTVAPGTVIAYRDHG
jgi:hypothetical protein